MFHEVIGLVLYAMHHLTSRYYKDINKTVIEIIYIT